MRGLKGGKRKKEKEGDAGETVQEVGGKRGVGDKGDEQKGAMVEE